VSAFSCDEHERILFAITTTATTTEPTRCYKAAQQQTTDADIKLCRASTAAGGSASTDVAQMPHCDVVLSTAPNADAHHVQLPLSIFFV